MRMMDFLSLSEWLDGFLTVVIIFFCMILGGISGFGRSTLVTVSGLLAFFTATWGIVFIQEIVSPSFGLLNASQAVTRGSLSSGFFVGIVALMWIVLSSVALARVGLLIRKFDWAIDRIGGGLVGCCGGIVFSASLQCALMLGMATVEGAAILADREMAAASLLLKSYSNYMGSDYELTLKRFLAKDAGSE